MTKQRWIVVAAPVLLCGAAAGAWVMLHPARPAPSLTLFGNVDLRQVELAFNDSDRISEVLVQEGDRLAPGEVVARLDVSRLRPQVAQLEGETAAQQAAVDRLHAGNRPQEIAEAKAALDAAVADAAVARAQAARTQSLWSASSGQAAVSRQDVDNARAAADAADAKVRGQGKAYELEVLGPRREDIAQGEAQLQALRAQLAVLRRTLADAELIAPVAGQVRARLMEPGEMASPQRPVLTIAKTDPKWVRAYVSEANLPHLHPGMAAAIRVDGYPGRSYRGWIGFISSVAEFTPKTVQTPELRTSLVYEVRAFVTDPHDDLRLGMPATVQIALPAAGAGR